MKTSYGLPTGCEQRCPGCSHRELTESASLEQKHQWLKKQLAPWKEAIEAIRAVSGLSDQGRLGYRDKTCLRAEWSASENKWKLGLRVRVDRSNYEVIDIPECPVHSPRVRSVAQILAQILPGQDILPLVFVVVSGTLVTLVLKTPILPSISLGGVAQQLSHLGITGLYINLNPSAGNRVFSSRGWHLAWGNEHGFDGEQRLAYGPDSFQQLIPPLYNDALTEAAAFLAPRAEDIVLDLCSGIGASLVRWRAAGVNAIGVELSGEAVRCANVNLGREMVLHGRASERLPQLSKTVGAIAVSDGDLLVFANPPRTGLEPVVTQWLSETRPKRIAYLSCSAGTLARDLSALASKGYQIKRIIPYDFFPQTHHVETLALLSISN